MIALVIVGAIAVALRRRALARSSCRHRYARCTPSPESAVAWRERVIVLLVHAFVAFCRSDDRSHRGLRLALWVLASIAPVFTLFFVGPTLEGSG